MERDGVARLSELAGGGPVSDDRATRLLRALDDPATASDIQADLGTEALLCEVLTPEETLRRSRGRLLAKAILSEKRRSLQRKAEARWRLVTGAVAATLAVAAAGIGAWFWQVRFRPGPDIEARGDFAVFPAAGGLGRNLRVPQRGDRVVAGAGGASVALGGYCTLRLDAGTEVVLCGQPGKEVVQIHVGRLLSTVEPGRGGYVVLTPAGAFEAKGTEFFTRVVYRETEETDMKTRRAIVTVLVLAGVVGFDVGGERGLIGVGGSRVFAAEVSGEAAIPGGLQGFRGVLSGTVVEKGEREFSLQVAKVELTWPGNHAEEPGSAVGKTLRLRVLEGQKPMLERLGTVKVGDKVAVGAAQRHDFWNAIELLVPAAEFPALRAKWEAEAREREAARKAEEGDRGNANRELEQEVRRLREENARLKREIEELRKR